MEIGLDRFNVAFYNVLMLPFAADLDKLSKPSTSKSVQIFTLLYEYLKQIKLVHSSWDIQ